LHKLTYEEALDKNLRVMDDTAVALARENKLPIIVCDMFKKGNLLKILQNDMSLCSVVK